MTFQQLSYVIEVAKCGSINKAAGKLFLSQSGISAAIMDLEEELGITIFERNSKGVNLTADGRDFLGYAASLTEQKNRILKLYNENSVDPSPQLHFSVSSQRYPFVEAAFLKMIQQIPNNRYRLSSKETAIDGVIDDVFDHRADVGVIFMTEMTEKIIGHLLNARNIEFRQIAETSPAVFLREGHPLLENDTLEEEDLLSYPFLTFEQSVSVSSDLSEEYPLVGNRKPSKSITVNNRANAVNILRLTDAVTTGSGLFSEDLGMPGLVSVPLKGKPPIRIGWIHTRGTRPSQQTELFISLLKEAVEDAAAYTEELRKGLRG